MSRRPRFAALAFGLAIAAVIATPAAAALAALFSVESSSMQPTLRQGDRFLADRGFYQTHTPGRGEVAIYAHPRRADTVYIKRIVAIAGDRIQLRDGRVILNGTAIDEPYAVPGDPASFYANTAEVTVPDGFVFVLGDNRALSSDSRVAGHGLVPVENLRARATYILWSSDLARIGTYVGTPAQ
jgi:signal peptidase I